MTATERARKEELDRTIMAVMERTAAFPVPASRIHQMVASMLPEMGLTETDITTELDFLRGMTWVDAIPSPVAGPDRYKLTAAGILARRRGDI